MKKIKRILKDITGITLIELVVAVTILGIISGPILYMYFDSQKEYLGEQEILIAQTEINRSLQSILDDLRKVDSEQIINNTVDSIQINGTSTVVIKYENSAGTNISEQVAYGVINNGLYKYKVTGDTPLLDAGTVNVLLGRQIAKNVSGFSFVDQGNHYDISISVDPPDFGNKKTREISLSTKFVPRFFDIR